MARVAPPLPSISGCRLDDDPGREKPAEVRHSEHREQEDRQDEGELDDGLSVLTGGRIMATVPQPASSLAPKVPAVQGPDCTGDLSGNLALRQEAVSPGTAPRTHREGLADRIWLARPGDRTGRQPPVEDLISIIHVRTTDRRTDAADRRNRTPPDGWGVELEPSTRLGATHETLHPRSRGQA